MSDEWKWYRILSIIVYVIGFLGSWGYAVATYGWFLGLALGWFPALFIGALAALLWPLAAIGVVGLLIFIRCAGG